MGRHTPVTRGELASAALSAADAFTELVLSAREPDRRVPATPAWTVTEVFGHVAMEPGRYRDLALGGDEYPEQVAELPAFNAEQVRTLPTRDLPALADRLGKDLRSFVATVQDFGDEQPLMFFDGGQRVRPDLALGTLLGEFLVHGHDIARALGRPWPIAPEYVPLVMEGLHQVLPGWVDPRRAAGHTATYAFRLRGEGACAATYLYRFEDGGLTVDPPGEHRPDVTITASPVTALLLNYGRTSQWRAALTGGTTARGRRPWLAAKLRGRFLAA
ncbi:maleylpyruvate isomerase family mycothiol-dependent enzyme [Streptomyces sp. ODS28]|uniref:maleylpyruvate isomerase family mycothiol-dependent enzyme n=1 Tax=Streptomyces sp. ODS28 TaxID=3136688 RepID=UPI0031EF84CD